MLQYNAVGLKKVGKTFKIAFLGPYLGKNRTTIATPKIKFKFIFENNNKRPWAFNKFLFHQNIICFDKVMNDFHGCFIAKILKIDPLKHAEISKNWC